MLLLKRKELNYAKTMRTDCQKFSAFGTTEHSTGLSEANTICSARLGMNFPY